MDNFSFKFDLQTEKRSATSDDDIASESGKKQRTGKSIKSLGKKILCKKKYQMSKMATIYRFLHPCGVNHKLFFSSKIFYKNNSVLHKIFYLLIYFHSLLRLFFHVSIFIKKN